MFRCWRNLLVGFIFLLMQPFSVAQLVASHDLTVTLPKKESSAEARPPKTESGRQGDGADEHCLMVHRDGVWVRQGEEPEKVSLRIVNVEPQSAYYYGKPIVVTVRFTNEGSQPVPVPWETTPIQPVKTGPNSDTTTYEEATIALSFGAVGSRKTSYLRGEAKLFAALENRAHHVELMQGQWVDVKFQVFVECDPAWECQQFPAGNERAEVSAYWNESVFTVEHEGCNTLQEYYGFRGVKSPPYELNYVPRTTGKPHVSSANVGHRAMSFPKVLWSTGSPHVIPRLCSGESGAPVQVIQSFLRILTIRLEY